MPAIPEVRRPTAARSMPPALPRSSRTVYEAPTVEALFDSIAPRYDILNRVLSGGIDIRWRRLLVRTLLDAGPARLLDVATGTADVAIMAARMLDAHVVGIDRSAQMLTRGERKVELLGLGGRITFHRGAAEALPFDDNAFDAVTVAFGVRNFTDLDRGLAEIVRVLRPGGTAAILEFSTPRGRLFGPLFRFYSRHLLPWLGGVVSGNREAYEYLPRTAAEFPDGAAFAARLRRAGCAQVTWRALTGGIATLYLASIKTAGATAPVRDSASDASIPS
jgi:demethylmenaquinone methyltransferase/2-methoxy-6-polyprenyl-1,4-benzoquinol methylase